MSEKKHNFAITCSSLVDDDLLIKALNHPPFMDWFNKMDTQITLNSIHFQTVDMFGPKVGFIKFIVDYSFNNKTNKTIVFLRSDAVAILVVLHCNGKKYIVLTRQPRIPMSSSGFLEIPAGMMDDKSNFVGVAMKELQEETGIVLKGDELKHLGFMSPSAGGTCERICLYSYDKEVTEEELKDLQGKCTGNYEEGEQITLVVIEYEHVLYESNDAKLMCALLRYERQLA